MMSTSLEEKLAAVNIDVEPKTESSSVAASLRENITSPLKTPIIDPIESATPPPAPILTSDQQAKYESVLTSVKSWKEVPASGEKAGPITEDEIMWLTRECILRYLRATKWSTADAVKRLLGTLTWRREYGVWELTGDYVSPENETGKQVLCGYDIASRPCHYLYPGKQNTDVSPRQTQHLVFMVERVIELMVPGQETLALLINFKSSKNRTNTAPGIGQGREVLNILQTHYPERLGRALIINVPWVVWGFFKLITPFIDPLTREKLKFNEDMRLHVPPEQLSTEFKGDLEFEYDHATYWPALLALCEERHASQKARWVKAGKHYGESEVYLKGGDAKSVAVPLEDSSEAAQETVKAEDIKDSSSAESPAQTHGAQANGNSDILAVTETPALATKGDRE